MPGPVLLIGFFFKTPIVITPVSKPTCWPSVSYGAGSKFQSSMLYPHFLHPKFHGDLGASPMWDGYMLSNMASGMASLIYPATRLQLLMSLLRLPQADVTLGHERWIISWEEPWPPSLLNPPGIGRWGPTSKWDLQMPRANMAIQNAHVPMCSVGISFQNDEFSL